MCCEVLRISKLERKEVVVKDFGCWRNHVGVLECVRLWISEDVYLLFKMESDESKSECVAGHL